MEKWKKRTVRLLASLSLGSRDGVSVVPYYPQKTDICIGEDVFFKRTVPEKRGVSSRRLYEMLCELELERQANIHSIMVLKGGAVICECSAAGYSCGEWHISHSMAKTLLGMVIGRLVDDGVLSTDMRLVDIFPEIPYRDKKFPYITVENLLSMTAGVEFAEVGSITESEWTSAFFASTIRFQPGEQFYYNSMNSYILARIAERVSSADFDRLADRLIFAPLGIKSYLWEKGPEGTTKGGWGLYMSPESWAKVGYMLSCGGIFFGKRILSADWVKKSGQIKITTGEDTGGFDYGYHMWIGRKGGELLFNGMLGQNLWLCPKNDIMVVVTCGNNELFQRSPTLGIIRKYLAGEINDSVDYRSIKQLLRKEQNFFDCRRRVRPLEKKRGIACLIGMAEREEFDLSWSDILGSYVMVINNAGIQPLILRAMQNNLDSVIEKIVLYRRGKRLYMSLLESGEEHTVAIGLYGYEESELCLRGEWYLVRAVGRAVRVRGEFEYRIEMIFPETASTRIFVIRKMGEGRISVSMSENPDHRIALRLLDRYRQSGGAISFASDMIERRLGKGEIERGIQSTFNPKLIGLKTTVNNYESELKRENAAILLEPPAVRLVRVLVDRLFTENTGSEKNKNHMFNSGGNENNA